jgi:hypothetical protein
MALFLKGNIGVRNNELSADKLWITMQFVWKLQIPRLWVLEVNKLLNRGDEHVA